MSPLGPARGSQLEGAGLLDRCEDQTGCQAGDARELQQPLHGQVRQGADILDHGIEQEIMIPRSPRRTRRSGRRQHLTLTAVGLKHKREAEAEARKHAVV